MSAVSKLEVRHLTKKYHVRGEGEFLALNNVNFTLESGEIIGLVGQSGSGKSTIAKILTQLESATSGEVLLDGNPFPPTARHCEPTDRFCAWCSRTPSHRLIRITRSVTISSDRCCSTMWCQKMKWMTKFVASLHECDSTRTQ